MSAGTVPASLSWASIPEMSPLPGGEKAKRQLKPEKETGE